jgi:RNA polymerase-binding transcription factor DksA
LRVLIDEEIIRQEREDYKEILGQVRDSGDDAVVDVIADLNIAGLTRELEEFGDITAALQRIQSGSYGVCTDCGAGIEKARLDAYPAAPRCLTCQEHYEATYATKPIPTI